MIEVCGPEPEGVLSTLPIHQKSADATLSNHPNTLSRKIRSDADEPCSLSYRGISECPSKHGVVEVAYWSSILHWMRRRSQCLLHLVDGKSADVNERWTTLARKEKVVEDGRGCNKLN
jgi:hypothetical protein